MRSVWKENNIYKKPLPRSAENTRYILTELPYPSGALHTGHWYAFTLPDIFVRYKRMQGDSVMFPIGFDSFGLPAENAAIKNNADPRVWTEKNIAEMEEGFSQMGLSIDTSQSVRTSDPSFYKWTQWLFTKCYEKGLVYRKKASTHWCDSCKTVIANEQVIHNAEKNEEVCERCKGVIVEREFLNWFFKITAYADRLIDDLDSVDWPDTIKQQQKHWIGRSKGASILFRYKESEYSVFTTRADTLFGISFLAISPEHSGIETLIADATNKDEIYTYIERSKKIEKYTRSNASREKTGVEVKGVVFHHPATNKPLPLYVADYVLANTGSGMVMGVPAHDERDYAFAKAYDIPILPVIESDEPIYSGEGVIINSNEYDGLSSKEAREKITHTYGEEATSYKLRDWTVSRQRYWGCPIPIVYDPEGNPHPIPKKHLPWKLPNDVDHTPTGKPPLARSQELFERTEKLFGAGWTPEVETFDTFVDSSWYFIRYLDEENEEAFCSQEQIKEWLPVDRYYGGAEHTTLHLLYSRFFYKAMYDMGLVPTSEPYAWRLNRGIILAPDGKKISKSLGNDIDISDFIERYGVDVFRMSFAFLGPFDGPYNYPYNPSSLVGIRKFLERVYALGETLKQESEKEVEACIEKTIGRVKNSYERHKFNTAISALMECVRDIKNKQVAQKEYEKILLLLAPLAPFLADHIWQNILGKKESIHLEKQPVYKEIESEHISIVVQVQGKKRGVISIKKESSKDEVVAIAKKEIDAVADIDETQVIYVQNRILNFVV